MVVLPASGRKQPVVDRHNASRCMIEEERISEELNVWLRVVYLSGVFGDLIYVTPYTRAAFRF